jgi:hypothetical protein
MTRTNSKPVFGIKIQIFRAYVLPMEYAQIKHGNDCVSVQRFNGEEDVKVGL